MYTCTCEFSSHWVQNTERKTKTGKKRFIGYLPFGSSVAHQNSTPMATTIATETVSKECVHQQSINDFCMNVKSSERKRKPKQNNVENKPNPTTCTRSEFLLWIYFILNLKSNEKKNSKTDKVGTCFFDSHGARLRSRTIQVSTSRFPLRHIISKRPK